MSARSDLFRTAWTQRVLVADGAMGTMLQAADPSMDDFQGYEGCNEILNVTRPDIVRSVHDAYFGAGSDCVETNTFGANHANLGEYDIIERIYDLARAGAATVCVSVPPSGRRPLLDMLTGGPEGDRAPSDR